MSGQWAGAEYSYDEVRNRIIRIPGSRKPKPTQVVERATDLAIEGRKLAIYDQETGLYARWFIEMRCAEECYRAVRYQRPLTVVVLQPQVADEGARVAGEVVDWLLREKRRSDLPSYLGNGRIAIVMPETDVAGAHGAIARLLRFVSGLDAGVSSYPMDGGNFEQLKAAAVRQLPGNASLLAA